MSKKVKRFVRVEHPKDATASASRDIVFIDDVTGEQLVGIYAAAFYIGPDLQDTEVVLSGVKPGKNGRFYEEIAIIKSIHIG